ncbi:MAG: hypothetical protein IJS73_07540 [Paludibacteraceae bacterium]|nr:hypothetical protein [Paludibacteraceae bacterium]
MRNLSLKHIACLILLFVATVQVAAQDEICQESLKKIKELYDKKIFTEELLSECESYLDRHCKDAPKKDRKKVKDIKKACEKELKKKPAKPAQPAPSENSEPGQPAPPEVAEPDQPVRPDKPVREDSVLIEQPRPRISLKADREYVSFPESGGYKLIYVSGNCPWDIYSAPDWLNINARYGENEIDVFCDPNKQFIARRGTIVIRCGEDIEADIIIEQDRNSDYIELSADSIYDSTGKGGVSRITVRSNKSWHINTSPSPYDIYGQGMGKWYNVRTTADSIVIVLGRNSSGYERRDSFEIVSPESEYLRKTVEISQNWSRGYVKLSHGVITSEKGEEGLAEIEVDTDMPDYRVQGLPQWCELLKKKHTSFVIRIKDNSGGTARTAQCRVEAGRSYATQELVRDSKGNIMPNEDVFDMVDYDTFTIRQGSRLSYINVSVQDILAPTRGGSLTIDVNSSGDWRIVNLPDWCAIKDKTDTSFTLTVSRNEEGHPRNAEFFVSASGINERITVKQE